MVGFGIALLLNNINKGRNTITLFLLIPYMIPDWITSIIWRWLYHAQAGLINYLLVTLHVIPSNMNWLGNPDLSLPVIALATIHRVFPFIAIVILGGLQNIEPSLFDSAKVDGANSYQVFRHITIPQLKTIISIVLILLIVMFSQAFTRIFIMTKGGPIDSSTTLPIYIYKQAFWFSDFSIAASAAAVFLIISIIPASLYVSLWGRK